MGNLYELNDINKFDLESWEYQSFKTFSEDLTSQSPEFPCIFGSIGFKKNMLRFGFYEDTNLDSILQLKKDLYTFLSNSRQYGDYTSYATFFNISRDLKEEDYNRIFWDVLMTLHNYDDYDWCPEVSKDPNNPTWEFCFGEEPIFVVCNTPSHHLRKSRYSKSFMVLFQPRWVFEGINLHSKKGQTAKNKIRTLIKKYDVTPEYPHLGLYGDKNNLEWRQYFIPDTNETSPIKCPFSDKNLVLK